MRDGGYPSDWDTRRKRVLQRDGYECQRCGRGGSSLDVHHVIPISRGGSHELSNLVALCGPCHDAEHPIRRDLDRAIDERRRVKMEYESSSASIVREFDPYGIEMHQGIQYLVGFDHHHDEIRIFRPKRIQWLDVMRKRFRLPQRFDVQYYLSRNLRDRGQYPSTPNQRTNVSTATPTTQRATPSGGSDWLKWLFVAVIGFLVLQAMGLL